MCVWGKRSEHAGRHRRPPAPVARRAPVGALAPRAGAAAAALRARLGPADRGRARVAGRSRRSRPRPAGAARGRRPARARGRRALQPARHRGPARRRGARADRRLPRGDRRPSGPAARLGERGARRAGPRRPGRAARGRPGRPLRARRCPVGPRGSRPLRTPPRRARGARRPAPRAPGARCLGTGRRRGRGRALVVARPHLVRGPDADGLAGRPHLGAPRPSPPAGVLRDARGPGTAPRGAPGLARRARRRGRPALLLRHLVLRPRRNRRDGRRGGPGALVHGSDRPVVAPSAADGPINSDPIRVDNPARLLALTEVAA